MQIEVDSRDFLDALLEYQHEIDRYEAQTASGHQVVGYGVYEAAKMQVANVVLSSMGLPTKPDNSLELR